MASVAGPSSLPCAATRPPSTRRPRVLAGRRDSSARRSQLAAAAARDDHVTSTSSRQQHKSPVLILPGFLFPSRQYEGLVADLRRRGHPAEVVNTAYADWLPSIGGGSFEWFLARADAALLDMHARHGRVALVGHSAGGWLARILLGQERYQGVRYGRSSLAHTLLTLGAPHQSIEAYPFGRTPEALHGRHVAAAPAHVRRSSLAFCNHFYPDAASLGGVRLVTACGDAVRGRALWGSFQNSEGSSTGSSADELDGCAAGTSSTFSPAFASSYLSEGSYEEGGGWAGRGGGGGGWSSRYDSAFAYQSYKAVCGRGDVDGDGVTPLCISQVPGAESLILPGVWHLPRRRAGQLWYGDAEVLSCWERYLQEAPQAAAATREQPPAAAGGRETAGREPQAEAQAS